MEDGSHNGECLNIAIVVNSGDAISREVERVYHVNIFQIGGGCLIGDVNRVLQRKIPNGEGLIFCVACLYAALLLMIKLRKAGRELAAAGTGRCYNNERAAGFDIGICAVALLRNDGVNIGGVALGEGVNINTLAAHLQLFSKGIGAALSRILSYQHRADIQSSLAELVYQSEHVHIVGDSNIGANFVALY